jgi:hypothetical protein
MSPGDVEKLETAIGRPLSPAVKRFFLNFPEELRIQRDLDFDDFELTDDVDALIEINRQLQPIDHGPHMLILGAGGCGETFWVDLDSPHGAVSRFDAGTDAKYSDELGESLEDWARQFDSAGEED